MKRTRLAWVTIVLALGTISLVYIHAHAQTGSGSQWSTQFTSGPLSSCPTPAAALILQCAVTNVGVEESVNGGAYVPVNPTPIQGAQGPAGPAGPVGATGATGPQGVPGPVQSFGTMACPSTSSPLSATGGIVFGPGCKETNP